MTVPDVREVPPADESAARLTMARERLEVLAQDPEHGAPADPDEVRALAEMIRSAVAGAETWDAGAPAPGPLWERADENFDLAIEALDRGAANGRSTADAVFHLMRCLRYLDEYRQEIVLRTRDVDRARNRNEFMSG